MAFDISCIKVFLSALRGPTAKFVNYHFSLPHLDKLFVVGKLPISEA